MFSQQLAEHLPELNSLLAALPVEDEQAPPKLSRVPSELELGPGRLAHALRRATERPEAMPPEGVVDDQAKLDAFLSFMGD